MHQAGEEVEHTWEVPRARASLERPQPPRQRQRVLGATRVHQPPPRKLCTLRCRWQRARHRGTEDAQGVPQQTQGALVSGRELRHLGLDQGTHESSDSGGVGHFGFFSPLVVSEPDARCSCRGSLLYLPPGWGHSVKTLEEVANCLLLRAKGRMITKRIFGKFFLN